MANKPASTFVQAGTTTLSKDDNENLMEKMEMANRREELKSKIDARMSKVAQKLTATWYVTDRTWPSLQVQNEQLSVSEFYPELNIAVDKFYGRETIDMRELEFKKKELLKLGIKYGYLTPELSFADLADQLGM